MKNKLAAILCTAAVLGGAYTADASGISLHVTNAPVRDVLSSLAGLSGRNIILPGTLSDTVTADIDDISADEAMRIIMESKNLVSRSEGNTIIVYDQALKEKSPRMLRSFRLSYADAGTAANMLSALTEKKYISSDPSSNTVILYGTPAEILQAESLISGIDIAEKQVKVEAEVLAVNKDSVKELGIDWDFKSLTGSAAYTRENWSEQKYVTDNSGNLVYDNDGNPKIRNKEKSGWKATIPDGYAGLSYGRSAAGHPYTFFFQAKLNALVSEGKAKVLAKPNIMTMNGHKAEILIGSRIPVLVDHMEGGVKTTAVEYKDAGIKLNYTPRISRNNEITADLQAEVSTPYLVPEMKAYRIITRQAGTTVRIPSGGTLTIGGLIDREESRTMSKVPILGDIPLLGNLFRSSKTSAEESEIVIIIKAETMD